MVMDNDDKTKTHVALTRGTMVQHYRIVEKIGAPGNWTHTLLVWMRIRVGIHDGFGSEKLRGVGLVLFFLLAQIKEIDHGR